MALLRTVGPALLAGLFVACAASTPGPPPDDFSDVMRAPVRTSAESARWATEIPEIEGKVTAVDAHLAIAILSVGRRDGVRAGMTLFVRHGAAAVGRILVEEVYEDYSAGRILPDPAKRAVETGDLVANRG
jgi:hypothetical protein